MLACDYNNIGDILIRESQEEFLGKYAKGRKIITIDYGETFQYLKDIEMRATKNTMITLTGGGNVDDRYAGIDRARNRIIKALAKKKCKIISFPQTINYSNTKKGRFYQKFAQKAYKKNNNLVFIAREGFSYERAKAVFDQTETYLMPDIVFTHDPIPGNKERNGIGLLLRNDEEKNVEDTTLNMMIASFEKQEIAIHRNDMTVPHFSCDKIHEYVEEKIAFTQTRRLVITDRLHGMILCYMTNTPCIVFVNSNHKISETYRNWLEDKQNFIILETAIDMDQIAEDAQYLLNLKKVQKEKMTDQFGKLIELIDT